MWEALLQTHPDKELTSTILTGLREGFIIGFAKGSRLEPVCYNMLSCLEHPDIVQAYIEKEVSLGRGLGPFSEAGIPGLHTSPFGVIPKKAPGTWRLIVDLSSPHGASVNDGIYEDLSSLSYVTVDMIADKVCSLGPGALLAKLDVKSALRIVPVDPADRWLLGMQWRGALYVDTVLPFGLGSAPKLFSVIADMIQFIAKSQGVNHITYYLDDFIILGSPNSPQCGRDLSTMVELCQCLGVPLVEDKIEGSQGPEEVPGHDNPQNIKPTLPPKSGLALARLDKTVHHYYSEGLAPSTKKGLGHSTIKSYLAAVRSMQIDYRLNNPFDMRIPRLDRVMKGKSGSGEGGTSHKKKAPNYPADPMLLQGIAGH
uniref:Reverse transcriptase domain-containing protein n=1 Tax=Amphimedon queenslandica TaxID=400682 RepID=A0A1X7V3E6_AMPQE